MEADETEFIAGPNDSGKRMDRVLRALFPRNALSGLYKALRKGEIRLNGAKARPETRLSSGDRISLRTGFRTSPPETEPESAYPVWPRFASLILFENDHILILNKPVGMLSHGPGGADEAAADYLAGSIPESLAFRPGPLHRLDRNSSGLLCVSKSIEGARAGTEAFRERTIGKYYVAAVEGRIDAPEQWIDSLARIKSEGRTVKSDVGGKKAVTSIFPLAPGPGASLCLFRIETGRTHQIRAQSSSRGHPLLGDRKYGSRARSDGYLLHCLAMVFPPGGSGVFPPFAEAPLPETAVRSILSSFGSEALDEIRSALRRIRSGDVTLSG